MGEGLLPSLFGVLVCVLLIAVKFSTGPRMRKAFQRGVNAYESGNLETAEEAFRKCLKLWPGQAQVHLLLASVLARQGHLGEAEAELDTAILFEPRNAVLHMNRGLLLANAYEARRDEAFEALEHAVDLDPQVAAALRKLGPAVPIAAEPRFQALLARAPQEEE